MKQNVRTIVINRPVGEVFEFTINPDNTDKWFIGTGVETTSEWPPKINTIYKNQWGVLRVTAFKENQVFQLSKETADYHVRYEYADVGGGGQKTELAYTEWGDDLTEPTTMEPFEKLKELLEK